MKTIRQPILEEEKLEREKELKTQEKLDKINKVFNDNID